jgi:Flp pilus assembly protein protease CpaA
MHCLLIGVLRQLVALIIDARKMSVLRRKPWLEKAAADVRRRLIATALAIVAKVNRVGEPGGVE